MALSRTILEELAMKLIVKCTTPEFSPDDIEWAFVTLDAPLLERALARRRMFREAKAQDDQLYDMYYWDTTPDFFGMYPDPDCDEPLDVEEASLEAILRDHNGQPIDWAREDLYRVSEETAIPDVYLRGVECAHMRVDEHGIAWTAHPKHLDADVRTSTIPWELLERECLFAPPQSDR